MNRLVPFIVATLVVGAPTAEAVVFSEVTATALPGVASSPGRDSIPPKLTGGATVGDCDGDGLPDIYFTGSGHDVLYRNRGDGTFEDGTVAANLGYSIATRGAGFADVDNDGDLDLYATGWSDGRHFLYVNDGHCYFTEEAIVRGASLGTRAIGRSVSFADYDRDGYLDLYVTELQSNLSNPGVPGPISRLLHNRGLAQPGFFTDVTVAAGLSLDGVVGTQTGTFAFAGRFTDFDGDGWPDLAIAGDFGESRLFWNDGNGHFTDGTVAAGVGTDEHGMGTTTGDLDGDGRLDLFVTSIYIPGHPRGTGNRLYRNAGNRLFTDVTETAGVRVAGWGWGTQAFDYDNDGDLDLLVSNGIGPDNEGGRLYVEADLGSVDLEQFRADLLRLWRNDGGGVFTEVSRSVGLSDEGFGQGDLTFDYDGDGDLDVLLTHDGSPPHLYRNDGGNAGHWIDIELRGRRSQRNGVGALVTVTPVAGGPAIVQEVSASSTYLAEDGTARIHVGLGTFAGDVDSVRIDWPSGTVQAVRDLPADTLQHVVESCDDRDPLCAQAEAQRDCILALNDAGALVTRVAGKRLVDCVRAATGGRLGAQTAEGCIATDPRGTMAAAKARTATAAADRCPVPPSFGPKSATEVNAAAAGAVRIRDVFGPNLDVALRDAHVDPAGAACQVDVAKAAARLANARVKAFNKCKRAGFQHGTINFAADLRACYAATGGPDVARLSARLARRLLRRCAAADVGVLLPGTCSSATVAGLPACIDDQSSCGVCLALDAGDHLSQACHRFVDGVAASYCGDRPATTFSAAREWNEEALSAIRIDLPRPPVHARNLFHVSIAMWDAWAAYDATADPYLHRETPASVDPENDRAIAISFTAYRVLSHLYALSVNAPTTLPHLDARMYALGLDSSFLSTAGDAPPAVGNRIAAAVIARGLADGSNEAGNYADPGYTPVNAPLIVKLPGTVMVDPNRWQPLALDFQVAQNGIPIADKVQKFVGSQWNAVLPFALTRTDSTALYIDPGPPPQLGGAGDDEYKAGNVELIRFSSELDPADPATIDISPASYGNNPLGTNDGHGYPVNPVTGQPYVPQVVKRADFERVLAEFWADGPESETPPGHWNVLANYIADHPSTVKRIAGVGPVVNDLEWDVKTYFALNGALHDAAVACWGAKRRYDSVRPISQVRYMAGRGQSTDPLGPSYDPSGLPLVPGLIEVITPESSAPGERHEALAAFVNEIAIYAWPGEPPDPSTQASGAKWIRGVTWVPYQRKTFVTPPFGSYFSGHSTYSRSAAELLTRSTGSPYFPDGFGEYVAPANAFLKFERGPTTDVRLQWASYYDAADQAGISRLFGGIHPRVDDFTGRQIGSQIGIGAWALASTYFDGTAAP